MVLRGGADHRGTADVDVLDGVIDRRVLARDGLLERVQVDGEQVDRLDAVFAHGHFVGAAASQ
jgi:hypothetical protein